MRLAAAGDGPSTALGAADVALAMGQEQRAVGDRDTPAAPLQPGVPTGAGGVTAGTESRAGAGAGCMRVVGEHGDSRGEWCLQAARPRRQQEG